MENGVHGSLGTNVQFPVDMELKSDVVLVLKISMREGLTVTVSKIRTNRKNVWKEVFLTENTCVGQKTVMVAPCYSGKCLGKWSFN